MPIAMVAPEREVKSISYSPCGRSILALEDDGDVQVWHATTGRPAQSLGSVEATAACFLSTRKVVTAEAGGAVRVWNIAPVPSADNLLDKCLHFHEVPVRALCASKDGTRIASGDDDGTVCVWDTTAGASDNPLQSEEMSFPHTVIGVALSDDGSRLAVISGDRRLRVMDTTNGQTVFNSDTFHRFGLTAVALAPDKLHVAVASADKKIWIWKLDNDREPHLVIVAPSKITSLSYSPDGEELVSGSTDKTVRLWEACSGTGVREFLGHTKAVTAVAYSPTRPFIASAGLDGVVYAWHVMDANMPGAPLPPDLRRYGPVRRRKDSKFPKSLPYERPPVIALKPTDSARLQCPVCQENRANLTFGCSHSFCADCADKLKPAKCPTCRAPIASRTHCRVVDDL